MIKGLALKMVKPGFVFYGVKKFRIEGLSGILMVSKGEFIANNRTDGREKV